MQKEVNNIVVMSYWMHPVHNSINCKLQSCLHKTQNFENSDLLLNKTKDQVNMDASHQLKSGSQCKKIPRLMFTVTAQN